MANDEARDRARDKYTDSLGQVASDIGAAVAIMYHAEKAFEAGYDAAESRITELEAKLEKAEKALEHYAAVNNWICPLDTCTTEDCPHGETLYLGSDDSSEWFHGYSVAQQALAEIRGGEGE